MKIEFNKTYQGDCLKLMKSIPDGSVDMVMTSPPYAMQRSKSYGGVEEVSYPAWMVSVLSALRPSLKPNANVIINIRSHVNNGSISDYVLRTRLAIRDAGWYEPEELIWYKRNGPPFSSSIRPRRCWEHLLWYSNSTSPYTNLTECGNYTKHLFGGSPSKSDPNEKRKKSKFTKLTTARITDVFDVPLTNASGIDHTATYPMALADMCIRSFSPRGGVVLDPFAGSGTTGIACKASGRRVIQLELDPKSCNIARNRYEGALLNMPYKIPDGIKRLI